MQKYLLKQVALNSNRYAATLLHKMEPALFMAPTMSMSTKITEVTQLTAISPVDGRYAKQSHALREYFTEYALMRYRVFVELEWFKRLFQERIITQSNADIQYIFE